MTEAKFLPVASAPIVGVDTQSNFSNHNLLYEKELAGSIFSTRYCALFMGLPTSGENMKERIQTRHGLRLYVLRPLDPDYQALVKTLDLSTKEGSEALSEAAKHVKEYQVMGYLGVNFNILDLQWNVLEDKIQPGDCLTNENEVRRIQASQQKTKE